MRLLAASLALLAAASPLSAAELPPLGDQAPAWAAQLGHGAVATAEKRGGTWRYAIAGEPFAVPRKNVPPEKVVFEIGSSSRVFTGILLAQAVVEGKLSLDDTLAKRLPVAFDHAETGAITLRQLASPTSCLPRIPANMGDTSGADPFASYDDAALFEYLAHAQLPGTPPCPAIDSILGFGTLGVVLERALGKPWAELVRERITVPLGMADTTDVLSAEQASRFAAPWDGDQPAHPWTFRAMAGAFALRSTLLDMSRLADALLAGKDGPLGAAWPIIAGDYAFVLEAGFRIGLGLLHANQDGADSYLLFGFTGGSRSEMAVRPAAGEALVLLASNAKAQTEAWILAWRKAGRPPAAALVAGTLSPAELDAYLGVYPIDGPTKITVLRSGDGLVARLTGQPFLPVVASARDEFFYKDVDAQLSFSRDASGKVTGMTLHRRGYDLPAHRSAEPLPHVEFPSPAALAAYLGSYDLGDLQAGSSINVTTKEGVLVVQIPGQPGLPVFATGKDAFEYDVVPASLTFERDAAGKVVALVLHQNGADMRAPRK